MIQLNNSENAGDEKVAEVEDNVAEVEEKVAEVEEKVAEDKVAEVEEKVAEVEEKVAEVGKKDDDKKVNDGELVELALKWLGEAEAATDLNHEMFKVSTYNDANNSKLFDRFKIGDER